MISFHSYKALVCKLKQVGKFSIVTIARKKASASSDDKIRFVTF